MPKGPSDVPGSWFRVCLRLVGKWKVWLAGKQNEKWMMVGKNVRNDWWREWKNVRKNGKIWLKVKVDKKRMSGRVDESWMSWQ